MVSSARSSERELCHSRESFGSVGSQAPAHADSPRTQLESYLNETITVPPETVAEAETASFSVP